MKSRRYNANIKEKRLNVRMFKTAKDLLMDYANLRKRNLVTIMLNWIKYNYNVLDIELLDAVRQSKSKIQKLNSTIFKTETDKVESIKFIIIDNLK